MDYISSPKNVRIALKPSVHRIPSKNIQKTVMPNDRKAKTIGGGRGHKIQFQFIWKNSLRRNEDFLRNVKINFMIFRYVFHCMVILYGHHQEETPNRYTKSEIEKSAYKLQIVQEKQEGYFRK